MRTRPVRDGSVLSAWMGLPMARRPLTSRRPAYRGLIWTTLFVVRCRRLGSLAILGGAGPLQWPPILTSGLVPEGLLSGHLVARRIALCRSKSGDHTVVGAVVTLRCRVGMVMRLVMSVAGGMESMDR